MIVQLYDCFKHWSEKGSVWILSDLHFDDKDCLKMNPNWISPMEQIRILNQYIHKNDSFICLGDVGNVERMNLVKHSHRVLLLGNHDTNGSKSRFYDHFNEVYAGPLFIGEKILLSHEPIGMPFALNIHGHDHNNKEHYEDGCRYLNLAANMCEYTPISLGKIIKDGALNGIKTIHRLTIDKAGGKK